MKRIKRILLTVATALCITAGVSGIAISQNVASAQTEKTGFYVEDGAAVRLKSEHEKFGIRFSANVGEKVEGATYNMLIVPAQLVDLYEADTAENKADIITYLKAYAASKGGSLSIVENCEVDEKGVMSGAIVNVLWQNINRKFVGVAYYEKDGVITVAEYADDRERSVVDVSKNALDSGDYTDTSDLQVLFEKVRYGEMRENGATAEEKQSNAYQYEYFYGASVNGNTVTTAANTVSVTLSGLNGSIENNALTLAFSGNGTNGATIDFGVIPAGHYRVNLAHTLVSGTFSSTITQNGVKELATVWETKELGDDIYEFYFEQATEGNASFTIFASDTATAGTVTLDTISLEPVSLAEFEFSRDEYMFGAGGLAKNINASEGNYCDTKVNTDWVAGFADMLNVESQRVWMSVPHIVKRADDSNELTIDATLATQFHNHFKALQNAGVKRIMVMLSRFVYPYGYGEDSKNCAPDPTDEPTEYREWLEMQYQAYKLLAKEFPEITLWECGNEYDLDTFLHKKGLKSEDKWGILQSAKDFTFTNTEKAHITADICYLASKAFKLYNPETQIVMPGMSKYAADKSNDHSLLTSANQKYYFEELYKHIESGDFPTIETVKVTDPDKYFDIIAWHCYADSVDTFETYNDTLLSQAAAHGDADKRVWITELGFTEKSFGGQGTEEAQNAIATLAGELLVSLEQEKYASIIEEVFFFRMSDVVNLGESAEACYGMYYSPNAAEKPSQAKPLAAVLYNYFNNASATVDELSLWEEPTVYELNTIGANVATFDEEGKEAWEYGVYAKGKVVDIMDGKATLNVTGVEQLVLSLGNVTKGMYKLRFDADITDGYAAILQVVIGLSINSETGYASWSELTTLYNAAGKSLDKFATPNGNTYELTLRFDADYENVGLILINNIANQVCGITLDNISFVALDYSEKQVIQDFDNGLLVCGSNWNVLPGMINVANAHVDSNNAGTFTGKIVDGSYQYSTGTTYSRVNLGWFEAGDYTFSFDVKVTGATNYVGNIRLFVCSLADTGYLVEDATYKQDTAKTFTEEWKTYTVSLSLEEARFVKLGVTRKTIDGVIWMDNFCVQKAITLNTIGAETAIFEEEGKAAWEYGVYAANSTVAIENGEAVLNTTGVEQLVLSLGNVTKGMYKLRFDADITGGYAAILQVVTGLEVNSKTGYAGWAELTTLYNAAGKSLDKFATSNGNTYELTLRFDADYENVGFILINNIANQSCSIALDNISFAALDYSEKQVIQDFDNGLLVCGSNWNVLPGMINVANAHVDSNNAGTFTGKIVDGSYQYSTGTTYSRVNLGWFEAGDYTFSFDVKVTGATNYVGNIRLFVCSLADTGYLVEDATYKQDTAKTFTEEWKTYTVSLSLEEARFVKLGVTRKTIDGVIWMDNFCVQKAITLNTIGAETAIFEEGKAAWEYGVYARNTQVSVEDGKAVLNTTGIEQLVLSLGDVTKGNYKLTFDATMTGGYPAIVQVVTGLSVDSATGYASWETLETLYNAEGKTLSAFVTPNGNTYEIIFSFDADYTSVGLILINNQADLTCGIAIDNISFKALDYAEAQTVQSFNGSLLTANAWASVPTMINVANTYVDYQNANAFDGKLVDGYYQVTVNSSNTYSRVDLGWFAAGTYTFTMTVKASGSNLNGSIVLTPCVVNEDGGFSNLGSQTQAQTFTEEWVTYSFTITLTQDTFVKLGVNWGKTMNATVCIDNITAQKTA